MAVLKMENVERIVTDTGKIKQLIAEGYEIIPEKIEEEPAASEEEQQIKSSEPSEETLQGEINGYSETEKPEAKSEKDIEKSKEIKKSGRKSSKGADADD